MIQSSVVLRVIHYYSETLRHNIYRYGVIKGTFVVLIKYLLRIVELTTKCSFWRQYFLRNKHRWFSGRMLACHAGGPGSIPGRCKPIFAPCSAHNWSTFFNTWTFCERNFRNACFEAPDFRYKNARFVSCHDRYDHVRKLSKVWTVSWVSFKFFNKMSLL